MEANINTVLLGLLTAFMALPRIMDALESAGKLPHAVGCWWRRRARLAVRHEEREQALTKLTENTDAILALLQPNGGGAASESIGDRVDAIGVKLDIHAALLQEHIVESARDSKLLKEHVEETAPLIVQFKAMRDAQQRSA